MIFTVVPRSILTAENHILTAHRYTVALDTDPRDVHLGSLVELIEHGPRPASTAFGPLLTVRALKSDNLDFMLDAASLLVNNSSLRDAYRISEPSLLVARVGGQLKPTWYAGPFSNQTFVQTNVIALRLLNTRKISLPYLIAELNSDYVSAQVKAYQVGSALPTLLPDDLLRLRVRMPSLVEQEAAVEGARTALIKLKEQELKQLKHDLSRQNEAYSEFASFKHAFVQPMANLRAGVNLLEDYLHEQAQAGKSLDFNALLSQRSRRSLQDLFNSFSRDFAFVQQLLERRESTLRVEDFVIAPLNLVAYLSDMVSHKRIHAVTYDIRLEFTADVVDTYANRLEVNADKHLLDTLFDYVISNAERHGFQKGLIEQNEVLIDVSICGTSEQRQVSLLVCNTGNPFPKGFTKEKYTRRGYSTGASSGIGGEEINKIIAHLGGELELVTDAKPGFPAGISLCLPLLYSVESTTNENL